MARQRTSSSVGRGFVAQSRTPILYHNHLLPAFFFLKRAFVTFGTIVRPFCCAWTRRGWLVASHIVGHLSSCVCSQRILKYLVILDMTALRVTIAEPCLGGGEWLWESEPRKWEKSKIIIYGNGSSGILNLCCNPVHVQYILVHAPQRELFDRLSQTDFILEFHFSNSPPWQLVGKCQRNEIQRRAWKVLSDYRFLVEACYLVSYPTKIMKKRKQYWWY